MKNKALTYFLMMNEKDMKKWHLKMKVYLQKFIKFSKTTENNKKGH